MTRLAAGGGPTAAKWRTPQLPEDALVLTRLPHSTTDNRQLTTDFSSGFQGRRLCQRQRGLHLVPAAAILLQLSAITGEPQTGGEYGEIQIRVAAGSGSSCCHRRRQFRSTAKSRHRVLHKHRVTQLSKCQQLAGCEHTAPRRHGHMREISYLVAQQFRPFLPGERSREYGEDQLLPAGQQVRPESIHRRDSRRRVQLQHVG